MVRVRVRADNHADVTAGSGVQTCQVVDVSRSGINRDVARVDITDQITVGAGAGHHTGVGRGQTQQVFQQRYRLRGLPVEAVDDLTVGAGQR